MAMGDKSATARKVASLARSAASARLLAVMSWKKPETLPRAKSAEYRGALTAAVFLVYAVRYVRCDDHKRPH